MKETHKCVGNETANYVSYQGVQSDDTMKTARFGCVYTQELAEILPPKNYFTTSKYFHSIFATSNH